MQIAFLIDVHWSIPGLMRIERSTEYYKLLTANITDGSDTNDDAAFAACAQRACAEAIAEHQRSQRNPNTPELADARATIRHFQILP